MLFTSYGEKFLGDPLYEPLMTALNRRGCAVLVHPTYTDSAKRIDLPYPGFMIEYLFETTRAAVNLVFTDTLTQFPDIKFILAHAGGVLPFVSVASRNQPNYRQAHAAMVIRRYPGKAESVLVRHPHCHRPSRTQASLQHVARPDRILFATDWPMSGDVGTRESVKALAAPGLLSEAQQAAIYRDNALKLFPRFAL